MSLNQPPVQPSSSATTATQAPEIGETFQDYLGFLQEGMSTPRQRIAIDASVSAQTLKEYANNPDTILVMTNATQAQKDSLTHVAGSISDGISSSTDFPEIVYANLEYIGGRLDITAAGSILLPKLKICGNSIDTLLLKGQVHAPILEFVRGKLGAGTGDTISYPKLKAAGSVVATAKTIGLPSLIVTGALSLSCENLDIRNLAQTGLGSRDQEMNAQEKRLDTRGLKFNQYEGAITINGPRYIHAFNLQVSYSKIVLRNVYQAEFNRLWGLADIRDDSNTDDESATKLTVIGLPSLERISDFAHLPNVVRLDLPKLTHGGRIIYAPKARYFKAPVLETMSGVGHIESSMQYPAYLTLGQCETFDAPKLQTSTFSTAEIKLPSDCLMNINPALFELQKMHLKQTDPGGRLSTIQIVGEHNKSPKANPTGLPTAQHFYDVQQKLIPTLPKPKQQ